MLDADTHIDLIAGNGIARSAPPAPRDLPEVVIEARRGWRAVDLRELYQHRDLLWFLSWRNIKGRYAQSSLGVGWVLVQPLFMLLTFTLIFGRVIQIEAPGGGPYVLFVLCGLVPWTFFSGAMTSASNSLISEAALLSKVYFPRLILPLSQLIGRLVDLATMFALMVVLLIAYRQVPRPEAVVILPLLALIATAAALGVGLWLSSLAVQYRDVAHMISFLAQIWMFLSPVVYPASRVPERYRLLYGLNPMVGVISGFRACLLGVPAMPWDQILESAAISGLLLVTGAFYFRRGERLFTDVV